MKKLWFVLLGAISLSAFSDDGQSNWEKKHLFQGRGTYDKDPNEWIYSKQFSQKFGMPEKWVSDQLKGVEALAFRVATMPYSTCGYGGQADRCAPAVSCILDIYVDETKHPLPWTDETAAGFSTRFSSAYFLDAQSGQFNVGPSKDVDPIYYFKRDMTWYRRPFSGSQRKEFIFLHNKNVPGDLTTNPAFVVSFDRKTIPGLSLISLDAGCSGSSVKDVTYRLAYHNGDFKFTESGFFFSYPASFQARVLNESKTVGSKILETTFK